MSHFLKDKKLLVLDFETTNFSPSNGEIIQCCFVVIENYKPVDYLNTYVQVYGEIDEKAFGTHGISKDVASTGISNMKLAMRLKKYINTDYIIVAHNVAFEYLFLNHLMYHVFKIEVRNSLLDTLSISRALLTTPHRLDGVAKKLQVELKNAHDAGSDTVATVNILGAFDAKTNLSRYINTYHFHPKYPIPDGLPNYVRLQPSQKLEKDLI